MVRKLLLNVLSLSLFVTSFVTAAERTISHKLEIKTSIYSVIAPEKGDTDYRALSITDGRVYKVEGSNEAALSALKLAAGAPMTVELKLNPSRPDYVGMVTVISGTPKNPMIELLEKANSEQFSREGEGSVSYRPTILDTKADAKKLFESVYSYEDGEIEDNCFDRAHYWARTFFTQDKVRSMKVFLFFTPKYQKEHDYKWWFHVAPFVYVGEKDSDSEYVLDPTYTNGPMKTHPWSKEFASEAKKCADGESLADYESADKDVDCMLVRANMYHYMPSNLDGTRSRGEWKCDDLKSVTRGIPAPNEEKSWKEEKDFLPEECK
jgi:hypothetical protein